MADKQLSALYHYRIEYYTKLFVENALAWRRNERKLARNLFEKAINAHANRMVSAGAVDEASLVTLYPEDIPNA